MFCCPSNKKGSGLLLFSVILFLFLCLFRIVYMDMFFDGLIYASISRNMAEGVGSFWYPYYTQFFLNPFYEHPPLVFGLQSLAYKLFGDNRLVEFLWGTCCGLIIIFFIYKIYRLADKYNTDQVTVSEGYSSSWFAIFLFSTIPTISWTFSNNILENTMTVFTMASVWLLFRAFMSGRHIFRCSFMAGILIFLAFLSKGPTAMFPIAVPVILLLSYKKIREAKVYLTRSYIAMFSAVLLIILCIWIFRGPDAAQYLSYYFENQVVKSLSGTREEVRYLYLVFRFLGEIVVPVFVAGFLYFILKITKKYERPSDRDMRFFVAMLLIAISSSFPTFFSPKQRVWYLFAGWPFYSLAIAYYFKGTALSINSVLDKSIIKKIVLVSTIILLFVNISLVTFFSGTKFKRLPDFYNDLVAQKIVLPEKQIIFGVCPKKMTESWEVVAFAQRYFRASFISEHATQLFLSDIKDPECITPPRDCELINSNPQRFALYKCKNKDWYLQ